MGPAEVAAWGILGTLWETFEALSIGIGDGGEVRVSFHLGNSNPAMAKISSYKSILISLILSTFLTSIVFIMGEDLAVWLTKDPALQHIIAELLPLVGFGNITLTAGSVCWALVGAQGRYRLATLIAFVCSWGFTMPLAALFTYAVKLDLQGIASAVVIGYSITGTLLCYVLLRSDWERLSKHIVELNAADEEEFERLRAENGICDDSSSSSSDEN
jgi:Na+-driven multidrug efflux pump